MKEYHALKDPDYLKNLMAAYNLAVRYARADVVLEPVDKRTPVQRKADEYYAAQELQLKQQREAK